jgi:hypothetical protein
VADAQPALKRAARKQTRKECERVVMAERAGLLCRKIEQSCSGARERDPCRLEERPGMHALE